jgi:hypothetical protein
MHLISPKMFIVSIKAYQLLLLSKAPAIQAITTAATITSKIRAKHTFLFFHHICLLTALAVLLRS